MEVTFPLHAATMDDEGAFLILWMDYLVEREKDGSLIAATHANLRYYHNLFRSVVEDFRQGVVVIAKVGEETVGAALYGPRMPLDASGGRSVCIGNGTYVAADWRRKGLSAQIYNFGFEHLRARGFTHITGSVDVANEVSVASVLARQMNVTSLQFLREL